MYIVNCSWILRAGWQIIKNFLNPKTRSKINILGSSFKDELTKFVDLENLPEFLGGTCRCKPNGCLKQPAGPWEDYYIKFPKESDINDFTYPPPPPKLLPK